MRATGVRPKASGMILAGSPALQQHPAFRIGHADRNGAMPVSPPMRDEFRLPANFPIPCVNKNYQFVIFVHDRFSNFGRPEPPVQ
jgi:hypothetical protein